MKKIPNHVDNLIIALFFVLVIHNVTLKPKFVTKSALFFFDIQGFLKFFGLRQNLTRQLPAQIKKGCSKFWICHTFKYCLNCGTNSIFKKQWADNVLIFFSFHTRPIFDVKILEFWKFFYVKIFIDRQPIDATSNNFFFHEILNFEKKS